MYVYLIYLAIFIAFPCLALAWFLRHELKKYRRTAFWCLVFVYVLGGTWDWLAVQTGLWRYNSAHTVGLWLGGLPVEEFIGFYLFGGLLIVLTALAFLSRAPHAAMSPGKREPLPRPTTEEAAIGPALQDSNKRGGA